MYGFGSITLLTRSIFGGNVSTISRSWRARSWISYLSSLNDLHHLWTVLSEDALSPV